MTQVVCNIIFKREEFPDLELECDSNCIHMRLHEPVKAPSGSRVCIMNRFCVDERCIEPTKEQKGEYFRCLLEGRI